MTSIIPDLFDPFGPLARAQALVVIPEGTVTDDGAGGVAFGSTLLVFSGGGDNWIRVAAGSHALSAYDALCVDLPPTNALGGTYAAYVDPYAGSAQGEKYPHRDRLVLGIRNFNGRVSWRFPALQQAANVSGSVVKLQEIKLAADGAIDFTGIPAGYRALRIEATLKLDSAVASANAWARVNNDAAANYYYMLIQGVGTAVVSGSDNANTAVGNGLLMGYATGTSAGVAEFGTTIMEIFGYDDAASKAFSLAHGGTVGLGGGGNLYRAANGLWNSTAVINRLTIVGDAVTTFKAGSRAALFGLV